MDFFEVLDGRGAQRPWLREHGAALALHRGDERAVHVRSVDVNLGEREPLLVDVLPDRSGAFLLRAVGRCDRTSEDGVPVQIVGNVFLVAIESLRAALSAVPHLGVFDRDASIDGDSLSNADAVVLGELEVLTPDRRDGFLVRRNPKSARTRFRRFMINCSFFDSSTGGFQRSMRALIAVGATSWSCGAATSTRDQTATASARRDGYARGRRIRDIDRVAVDEVAADDDDDDGQASTHENTLHL